MSIPAKYLALFLREALEHLNSIQQGLLHLEEHPDDRELIEVLMRNAHTVKGSARMLGLEAIGNVAHRMEDLFKAISDGERSVTPGTIDLLLTAGDTLNMLIGACESGDDAPIDLSDLMRGFERGELARPLAPLPSVPVASVDTTAGVVKVSVDTLERMSRYFGELELVRQRLAARLATLQLKGPSLRRNCDATEFPVLNFEEDLHELESLLQDVAAQNRKLRMLPLHTVTDGFGRIVRDLARAYGKEVRTVVCGDELEIDRLVLDDLRPAFTHLLTNAIAHGIEHHDERVVAGKSPAGELNITARQEGERFSISLRDDGRGMDPSHIRATAVERGLITSEQAEVLNDDESLYLTLRHGFTTQSEVGSISGRGVGLDVVAEQLRKIKGSIILRSEPGRFCEVTLQLPRSLMSIDGVVVSCSGERYVIPTAHVAETLLVTDENLATVNGALVYEGDQTIRVISLADLFGLPMTPLMHRHPAVMLRHRDRRLLCLVDAVLDSMSVVILKFSKQFVSVRFTIGATLLTDGRPVFILNVQDLFAAVHQEQSQIKSAERAASVSRLENHILVVDDSVTSRNLEAAILRAQGYQVTTAENGADALSLIDRGRFDMVVSDFEMPLLNGIELTRRLRERYPAEILPVMIVSSLFSEEDQYQALSAGVQSYMVKGMFDQDKFLSTIQKLTATRNVMR